MKIPLRYNLGSLWVRRTGTAMTILGIGLTVAIFVVMMSLVYGLESTFVDTGQPNQLVIIRQGGLNETNSYFNRDLMQTIRYLPGIAKSRDGEPMVSGESVVVVNQERAPGESSNLIVRGLSGEGFELRPETQILEGRVFRTGLREILVSRSLSNRFQNMKLGDSVHMSRSQWTVVGIFDTGGTAYDSEIWADYSAVSEDWDRPIYSSILLRAESEAAAKDIERRISDDQRINLQAVPQQKLFEEQTSAAAGIQALGWLIAVVMGVGAAFAAMNMMYGAVMARSREVGTLRAIGFRRRNILASFLVESVIVALAGGLIGCLLALPLNGISTGTANFQTFSEVLFELRVTPEILLRGLLFASLVGVLGGYLPARRAARVRLIDILRG